MVRMVMESTNGLVPRPLDTIASLNQVSRRQAYRCGDFDRVQEFRAPSRVVPPSGAIFLRAHEHRTDVLPQVTDNAPIDITIPTVANGTSIKATVINNNADVHLALPSTFEGRIMSQAAYGRVKVVNTPIEHLNRTYEIERKGGCEQEGLVWWRPEARDEIDTEASSRAWVETIYGDSVVTLL